MRSIVTLSWDTILLGVLGRMGGYTPVSTFDELLLRT